MLVIFPAQLLPFTVIAIYGIVALGITTSYIITKLKFKELLNFPFIVFGLLVILSLINYRRGNITERDMSQCVLHYWSLALLYDLMMIIHKSGRDKEILNTLLFTFSLYTVINILSVFIIGTNAETNLIYFFGNKFRTSYFVIYYVGLLYAKHQRILGYNIVKKITYMVFVVIAIIFTLWITCSTAAVALIFFLAMAVFWRKESKLIKNPYFIMGCIIASGFIMFIIQALIGLPIVQRVLNLLQEDSTLTGRTRIYNIYLFPLLERSKLIGFGYGNTAMLRYSLVFGNAQNGMFDFMLNNGFIGLASYLLLVFTCIRKATASSDKYPLYLILFSMILTSVVEVTFGAFMLIVVFAIRWYETDIETKMNVSHLRCT